MIIAAAITLNTTPMIIGALSIGSVKKSSFKLCANSKLNKI